MQRALVGYLIVAVAACFATPTTAADPAAMGPRLDAIVASYHDAGLFQGAVLVALDDEIILRKAYGHANLELGVKNTPKTRFAAASLGKALTAGLILQLRDQGRLSLEDRLAKHLPEVPADLARVTIHQLLSHTAGIPWPQDAWPREAYVKSYALDELVTGCNTGELQFEPGSEFRYCNCCYHYAAAIVEAITGNDFASELKRRILDPLKMHNTGIARRKPVVSNRAAGYERNAEGDLENALQEDQSYALGAGGIYTTVDDLYKWDRALYNDSVLSASSRKLMFTKHEHGSGYGWAMGAYGKKDEPGTFELALGYGGTPGYASAAARLLDDRYFIVFLGNLRQIPQTRLLNDLWNPILGIEVKPLDDRDDAPHVLSPVELVEAMGHAFNEHDVDAMLEFVTDDVEWIYIAGSAAAVETQGKAALREAMTGYFQQIPSAQSSLEATMASGRFVTARERASWEGKDGKRRSQASVAVYEIRDHRIARVWYYPAE